MLKTRILTGLLLGFLTAATILFLPNLAVALFFGALVIVGAWEWAVMSRLSPLMQALYVGMMLLMLVAGWSLMPTSSMPLLISLGVGWWLLALILLAVMTGGIPTDAGLRSVFVLLSFPVLVPAWLAIVHLHRVDPNILVFMLALVVVADTAAYFAGRKFGRTALAPAISPRKTREGLWGAIAASAAFALLASWWLELPPGKWPYFIGLSLIAVLFSVVGDLLESLVKRYMGVKDSGHLLPGHGGVLDRIDGVTAAAPVFVLGLQWL